MSTLIEWDSGVLGVQCDHCGRTTICRSDSIHDAFGESHGSICRPCFEGQDDSYWIGNEMTSIPIRLRSGAEILRTDPDKSWGAGPWGIRAKSLADLMDSVANDHQPNWSDPDNPYCSCERDLWDGDCDSPDLVRWIPFLDTLGV